MCISQWIFVIGMHGIYCVHILCGYYLSKCRYSNSGICKSVNIEQSQGIYKKVMILFKVWFCYITSDSLVTVTSPATPAESLLDSGW